MFFLVVVGRIFPPQIISRAIHPIAIDKRQHLPWLGLGEKHLGNQFGYGFNTGATTLIAGHDVSSVFGVE